jgi:hypothetical protein
MYKELSELINYNPLYFDIDFAIDIAENELRKRPLSEFDKMLGRDLSYLIPVIFESMEDFYYAASIHFRNSVKGRLFNIFNKDKLSEPIKAIFCQLNRFTTNTEELSIEFYSYTKYEKCNNTTWLTEFNYHHKKKLILSGFEDIQAAYKLPNRLNNGELFEAAKICELLVILGLAKVFKNIIKLNNPCSNAPIFITAIGYDYIFKINQNRNIINQSILKNELSGCFSSQENYKLYA